MKSGDVGLIRIRGMFKHLVLYVLKDGPLHGYGIMKKISELLQSDYMPSPGIVYPTLQMLEDMGLVESRVEGRRKVYRLTEEGMKVLRENMHEVEEFIRKIRHLRNILEDLGIMDLLSAIRSIYENLTSIPPETRHKIRSHIQEIIRTLRSMIKDTPTHQPRP